MQVSQEIVADSIDKRWTQRIPVARVICRDVKNTRSVFGTRLLTLITEGFGDERGNATRV
jgi:hypothetical protein